MFTSSIGKKAWMALTGLALLIFVVGHLIGNLQIFLGPEWLNDYAFHLTEWVGLLWTARALLLITLLVHIGVGIKLSLENRSARPVRYAVNATVQASPASRTMIWSGLAVTFFIIYHLCHFTFGAVHSEFFHLTDKNGHHDVYSMVVLSFQNVWILSSYLAAMFFLMMHLMHGTSSFLQTLGLMNEKSLPKARLAGTLFGIVIFLGYSSIAVASYLGWLQPMQHVVSAVERGVSGA